MKRIVPIVAIFVMFFSIAGCMQSDQEKFDDAIDSGNSAVVKELMHSDIDIEKKDKYGETALFRASRYGHFDIARILLSNKADVDARELTGFTPLLISIRQGYSDITQLLLNYGADPNIKNIEGWTPLMMAVFNDNTLATFMLIDNKVDINAIDNVGRIALIFAAEFGKYKIAEILLAHGVNTRIYANDGLNAYDTAIYYSHTDVAELIKQY